jgi:hypothetical protein
MECEDCLILGTVKCFDFKCLIAVPVDPPTVLSGCRQWLLEALFGKSDISIK